MTMHPPPTDERLPTLMRARTHVDLPPATLVERALAREEGRLSDGGALTVDTGHFTGRSPSDRFVVRDAATAERVDWGEVNQPLAPEAFERLRRDVDAALADRDLFVQHVSAGADPRWRVPVKVVTEYAWHGLFARNLFRDFGDDPAGDGWTVLDLPSFQASPERHGSRGGTLVALDLTQRLVIAVGTAYAGEIKKSIFTALNDLLPQHDVLPLHGSANRDERGRTALFFGLSGTGKTTLSADPERVLIGDDEHGWSDRGVFNFEGGCYAKVVRLDPAQEPEIFAASTRFGAVLENVALAPDRRPDFFDFGKTENTRAAYPLEFVANAAEDGLGAHPSAVVFLTADAFGVLPPIARLNPDEAMAHFLSGYTAKVAGTERGVSEPQATFSACFGAPFMPRRPTVYARMLRDRLERHGTGVWLVNTGWTGGPPGVGERIALHHTRAMVRAALDGDLDDVALKPDPAFGLRVPEAVPGVPPALLRPREGWADGAAYDAQAEKLAGMFRDAFTAFEDDVDDAVRAALPGHPAR